MAKRDGDIAHHKHKRATMARGRTAVNAIDAVPRTRIASSPTSGASSSSSFLSLSATHSANGPEAETDLHAAEARYRSLLLATGQINWRSRLEDGGDWQGDGHDWDIFTGQDSEAANAWGWLEALHPEDRERVRAAWKAAIATGSTYEIDYRVRRHDGEYRWLLVRGVPVEERDGGVREWMGTATDITERKQAEERLREREEQLAEELADVKRLQRISSQLIQEGNLDALYQQILDAAIALMRSDVGSMQMFDPNRNALRLLAWKGFHPASAAFWEWVSVDSGASCGIALRVAERVVIPDIEADESIADTEDLEHYRLSDIRAVQSTPLVARDGRLVGMLSTHWHTPHQPAERELRLLDVLTRQVADLIERKHTEAAAAHLAAIVTSAEDAIASKTLEGIVTSWNASAERMFGYTAQEMIGQPITRLFPPDRLDEEDLILARIRAGERIEHFETVRLTKDGRPLDVSLTISPMRDSAGTIIGASKIVRDITERKRTEEALRAVNQRLDEFLHTATHELKTPLTALQANLQLADRRLQRLLVMSPRGESRPAPHEELETVAQFIARNQQQVRRLTRLVNDLVDAARIQAGKLDMRPVRCDLAEILWEAVTDQRAVWPERTIELRLPGLDEGDDGAQAARPVLVDADADRVGQVVANYLTNALKYSAEGRPVAVTLRVEGDVACVMVRDEGPGIPADEQIHIWERGHRVPGIEPRGEGVGLGLGLYISRSIVERHGGAVGVESAPGAGSTFWFTLPLTMTIAEDDAQ